jgi:xylulose-5-phosphate/fructose-6-phosphate phosphoketolase
MNLPYQNTSHPSDENALLWMKKYLRFVDYIGVAQLYLKENYLLEEKLAPEHIKARILGHWGTVPGLNFIYAQLNYLISKHEDCEMLLVTGPGHGAPSILANLFMEGSLEEVYPSYPVNVKGLGNLVHDFSWPHSPFPSHVTPTVPGSILEGGELGYSLGTAYGAILDNPDLIAAVVVGDGESETGPIATAWHSNKFYNPKTSGAVLPIVHINGYKISNPTIFGRMDDEELTALFTGYGYEPLIVEADKEMIDAGKRQDSPEVVESMTKNMMAAMEYAYGKIRAIQKKARAEGAEPVLKPKWPVILLRSPKGWKGIDDYHGEVVEGSFHAHGIPVGHPKKEPEALEAIEHWLGLYDVNELVEDGKIKEELFEFMPSRERSMGMNPNAIGGNMLRNLHLPSIESFATDVDTNARGALKASSMKAAAQMFKFVFAKNDDNFRLFCPDEVVSNKLGAIFEETKRAFMWPQGPADENISPDGRVMEMLSEHTLQAWYMGYLLTGRHGIFVSYEAFTTIITSMVDQYAKFLKQAFKVAWRTPVASAIYINSSVGWRQDHNGYSHQNPSFVSNVLQKHGDFCQVYYPADANAMLVALEETMSSRNKICVIVAGKRDLPQWQTLEEARAQAKVGIGIWEWVGGKEASKNPDVVLASAGDYITHDALLAAKMCREMIPEMKIRYVNVSEITALCLGDYCPDPTACTTEGGVNRFFTADKPVVFSYHGYVNDVEQILWPYVSSARFSIHGYREEGSTTTPFDMKVVNKVSCYHLAMDMIKQASKNNPEIAGKRDGLIAKLEQCLEEHHDYIRIHGDDPQDVKELKW